MKVSIVTKVRIGFSGAIFVLVVVAETMAGAGINVHHRGGTITCLVIGLVGLLMWATSRFGATKQTQHTTNQEAPAAQTEEEDPLAPFRSRRYWGVMLMLSAVTLAVASAFRYAAPKPPPVISVAHAPASTPVPQPPAEVAFPPLKLEGLIVHGTQSSALINGQVVVV